MISARTGRSGRRGRVRRVLGARDVRRSDFLQGQNRQLATGDLKAAKMAALHVAARGAPQTLPPVAQRLRSPRSGNAQDARCPSAARPEAAPYHFGRGRSRVRGRGAFVRRLARTLALPGERYFSCRLSVGFVLKTQRPFLVGPS